MRASRLVSVCWLAWVVLPAATRAQGEAEDGLPSLRLDRPRRAATAESPDPDLVRARALAAAVEDRVLSVARFEVTAGDVALLVARDPQAALVAQDEASSRRVGTGVKVELGGLTVIHHAFHTEADALAHAGAFLHRGLQGAVELPRLQLVAGERPAQLIELAGRATLLLWGPALEEPARAARALAEARRALGVEDAPQARALLLADHVQVSLLRPELPSLAALREALEAARPGQRAGELVEQRGDLRVFLEVRPEAGRLELSRAPAERARALGELAAPLPPPAEEGPRDGLIQGLRRR